MTLFSDTDTIPSAASLYHQNLSLSLSLSLSGIQHALWIKIKLTSFSLFSSLPTTKPTFIFPPLYFPKSPSGSLVSEPLLFLQPFTPFLIPTEKKGWFLFYSCLLILFLLPLIACWESLLFWVFVFPPLFFYKKIHFIILLHPFPSYDKLKIQKICEI